MANKKWIQKANRSMERRGTKGKFTEYCGGRVTQDCIDRAKNSDDPTLVRRAALAETFRSIGNKRKRAQSGLAAEYAMENMQENLAAEQAAGAEAATGGGGQGVDMGNATNIVGGADQMLDMAQDVMGNDPTKKGQIAMGAGSGALKGAMALSALGPIGMAAGALGGGIMAGIKAKKAKEDALEAEASAQEDAYQKSLRPMSFATTDTGVAKEGTRVTKKLPGGLELKLRSGAKKYVGNKHDEAGNGSDSGIILEHSTKKKQGLEVEDGELEVKDKKGSYIVSNYLKNPSTGNTLAEDLENELKGLDEKRDKKQIAQINEKYVKMNEELKDDKKEPDEVKAAHGIRRKFMQEGGRTLKTYEEFVTAYPKFDDPKFAYNSYIKSMTSDVGTASDQMRTELQEVNQKNAAQGHADVTRSTTGNLQGINEIPEAEVAASYPKPDTTESPEELEMSRNEQGTAVEPLKKLPLSRPELKQELAIDANKKVEEMRKMERPDKEERKDFREANKNEKVPFGRFYGQGTGLQALGALAYLTKKDDPEAPVVSPGYLNRVPPARYKSFAPERAASEKAYASQVNAIDTSIAGPAAIAARQAAMASQAASMSGIATAETRDRLQTNRENAMNDMRIAMANQQAFNNAQRANATAKYMADREKFQNKYAALDKIGDVSAQAIQDRNQAVSEDLTAEATQIGGAYTRAKEAYDPMFGLGRLSRKNREAFQNRQTGLTPEEAKSLALLNDKLSKEEETATEKEAKKGARKYLRKAGKVGRRRIKKK
jgi:hypothetical protein